MHKQTPISRRDQAQLIHTIHADGHFEGIRGGRKITLKREQSSLFGSCILYRVELAAGWRRGSATTVAAAVDDLNKLIQTEKLQQAASRHK